MKKFTSILVALAMLAAMMVTMMPTASAAWDGSSASAGLIGSGTEFDPYIISSENDLAYVAKQVNEGTALFEGQYLKLTVDLDLGGHNWTPIGASKPNYFRGIFDGDGHTITGLTVVTDPDNTDALYAGVFGRVDNGTVMNLTVDGAKLLSYKYAGAVVGNLTGKAEGAPAAVINCHALNCEILGLQIGGVVGRASQSGVSKGHLKITGCTATNVTFGAATADTYPGINNKNHFVGGIVGAAGATIVDGCYVSNMTGNIYGTSFAPVGGIVGVQGADDVSADVTNCYVIGMNVTASADSHQEKTAIGGLIGTMAHVEVASGDSNREYNVFNCFVSDITITNATSSIRNGVVTGWIKDTIFFNDVFYVPTAGLESYGEDMYLSDYPFMSVNAISEIKAADLNLGNSTAVWVDDVVSGHPVLDLEAVLANVPAYVDYYVENAADTSEEVTTEAPDVTDDATNAPEGTDEPTDAPEATDAPTDAPIVTDTPAGTDASTTDDKNGCGGMITSGAIVIALLGTAVVFKKKK